MATRFYLVGTAEAPAITPTPDAAWENTASLVRCIGRTTKISDTLNTVTGAALDDTDQDVIYRQYVTDELTAGQTITGSQAIKAQCRVSEADLANNLFFAVGIRVINVSTVQKTVLSVTRDNTEAATSLTNRRFTATSAATNYTTVSGDRLVIEIGLSGNPSAAGDHTASMRLGDSSGSDLSEDDTSTTDNNPWLELADTLTFGGGTSGSPGALTRGLTEHKLISGRLAL